MKKFCPMIHGVCEDGFPDNKDLPCVFWDPLYQVCTYIQTTISTYEALQLRQEAMRREAEKDKPEH